MFAGQIPRPPGRLPAESAGFVGREAELARLSDLLHRARLVTVTGPGGVGKTRVALRAAARASGRFTDGVCLVELSSLRNPTLLPHTVADALGIPERSPDARHDGALAHLRDRNLLLILDTCEHLIDACAAFAEAVIAEAPGVTLLATSREPLDVIGENACPVPPLPVPPLPVPGARPQPLPGGTAVDLFLQRAAAAVPGFTVTPGELPHAIQVCRRLDGIPLAIELAAVRLRALPLAELASHLDNRPGLLAGGHRGGRHKTLRDAIGWSYELCTPAEQTLWSRLSVFAAPVSIDAAEEVCADAELDRDQIMATMIRLVDKSILVRADPAAGDGTGEPTRYRMLDTIREFGAEQLAASGAQAPVRNRFVTRYLAMALRLRDCFLNDDQLDQLRELHREHANVRAALRCTLESQGCESVTDGVALAIALFLYWRSFGMAKEGSYWLGKAAERAPDGSAARSRVLLARAYLAAVQGNADIAVASVTEGMRLGTELGDGWVIAHGYLVSGLVLAVTGKLAEAAAAGREAERRLTELDARLGLANLAIQRTYLALLGGDVEEALGHAERGVLLIEQYGGRGERWLHGGLFLLAATALFVAGRDIESAWAATRALRIKDEIGDVLGIAFTLEVHGWLAARSGRQRRAAWLLGGADPLWKLAGGRLVASEVLERLHADAVARAAAVLGSERFDELFTQAARQPRDNLVAFAITEADEPAEDGTDDGNGEARARPSGRLTAREQEVAALVAEGLSNRQIAEQLFISRRTVDAHVEHIFGKLGISSRVQIAASAGHHPPGPVHHPPGPARQPLARPHGGRRQADLDRA